MTDLIRRADAIEAVRKLKIVEDNKNFPDYAYNAGIETAIKTIEVMLSADAEEYIKECNTKTHDLVHRDVIKPKLVDCTDFVNWLIEEVMDDEMWELNAVANGEIIARKMAKLGLLEVLDGYYIRTPNKPQSVVAEIKIDTDEIVSKAISALSAEAVQGEWIDEDGNKVPLDKDGCPLGSCWCNQCHEWLVGSDEYAIKGNFCPNCGVRMYKGGDDE